jgi:hypothetical protein
MLFEARMSGLVKHVGRFGNGNMYCHVYPGNATVNNEFQIW